MKKVHIFTRSFASTVFISAGSLSYILIQILHLKCKMNCNNYAISKNEIYLKRNITIITVQLLSANKKYSKILTYYITI